MSCSSRRMAVFKRISSRGKPRGKGGLKATSGKKEGERGSQTGGLLMWSERTKKTLNDAPIGEKKEKKHEKIFRKRGEKGKTGGFAGGGVQDTGGKRDLSLPEGKREKRKRKIRQSIYLRRKKKGKGKSNFISPREATAKKEGVCLFFLWKGKGK